MSEWKTTTIAESGTTSAAVDLERPYRSLIIMTPTLSEGTLNLTVSDIYDGTYQNFYSISLNDGDDDIALCSTFTGGTTIVIPCFGFQFFKIVVAEQAAARSIKVRGFD